MFRLPQFLRERALSLRGLQERDTIIHEQARLRLLREREQGRR